MRRPLRPAALLFLAAVLASASPHEEAAALIAKGEFRAAERIVEPLALVKKPDAVSLHQLSQIRAAQQRVDESIRLVERAIKLDSGKAEYFSQLGQALQQQFDVAPGSYALDRIRKAMEQSVKLDPHHVPGLLGLAKYHTIAAPGFTPNFKLAEEYARRAAEADPFQGEMDLGRIDLIRLQVASALAHYEKAVQARPDDPLGKYLVALALIRLDRKDEARAQLREIIRQHPKFKAAPETLQSLEPRAEDKPGS